MRKTIIALLALFAFALAPVVCAKTLRWASQGDYLTADPDAQNEIFTNSLNGHVYEALVSRDENLKVVPALAVSWASRANVELTHRADNWLEVRWVKIK